MELVMLDVFALIELPSTVSEPPLSTKIPPPAANRPNGGTAEAELPVTVELCSDSEAFASTAMPPPSDWTPAAWLSLTVESTRVIAPQSSMPAAPPKDAGQGTFPGQVALTLATEVDGTARLPVMMLRRIVTVVPLNVAIPPPSAVAVVYPGP